MKLNIKHNLFALLAVPALALSVAALIAPSALAADCSVSGGIAGAAQCTKSDSQSATLFGDGGVFKTITNVLLFIIGAVSVIMLIIGGIRYTISGGDQAAVTAAKNTILYAIVGVVVAILAYAAVNFVITSFVPAAP